MEHAPNPQTTVCTLFESNCFAKKANEPPTQLALTLRPASLKGGMSVMNRDIGQLSN